MNGRTALVPESNLDRPRLEALLAYCSKHGLISPRPQPWFELWQMLPDRKRIDLHWEPPLPLIIAPRNRIQIVKMKWRFVGHLLWAFERGALMPVENYLRLLPPHCWSSIRD